MEEGQRPRVIGPRTALKGRKWAVGFDFGSHFEVDELFMTKASAERRAAWLNRERGSSPGGTPWEVARIDYSLAR